jgi:hypothetical protein
MQPHSDKEFVTYIHNFACLKNASESTSVQFACIFHQFSGLIYICMCVFIFQHHFSMFLHKSETFMLMEQLTNLAMKQ